MVDLEYRLVKMRDTYDYDVDGNPVAQREYVFRLGPYGPFTEKVPRANFDANAIHVIVATLRAHLQGQPS